MARQEGDHDGHGPAPAVAHAPFDGAPTESLVAGTVGDRCVNCGAPLSSDQRYCINCGERRGAPRFSVPTASAEPTGETTTTVVSRQSRRPRFSSGATLIAGVGTLLLAMGVGVLIGHNTSNPTSKTPATQVITVNGGGGTPTTSAGSSGGSGSGATANSGSHHKSGAKSKAGKSSANASKPPSKKVAQKAQQAASKVLGGKNTPPPTVTVGQKGSGSGYNKKTHKFDGSFFGQ